MPKLTETTNDKIAKRRLHKEQIANGGELHVEAAHEPLSENLGSFVLDDPVALDLLRQRELPATPPAPVGPAAVPALRTPKVAIIGTAPSSRLLAPFHDPSWTIWACSPGNMQGLPRIDCWFEIHGNFVWPEHKHYGEPYIQWLQKQPFPIYMHKAWPTHDQGGGFIDLKSIIPNHRLFPHKELVAEFGRDFFSSSFAWMMAYAIHLGAKEIALYGVDMASRDEYIQQRPGFYFFKREAERRGIRISAPNESDIMMSPGLYGYSEIQPFARKLIARKKEIQERITPLDTQLQQMAEQRTYLKGALEDIEYVLSIWSGVQDEID